MIARTSAMRYKKTDTPIDQIGRELGVDYVLEESARRETSRIGITAELIQVRGQTQTMLLRSRRGTPLLLHP